MTMVWYLARGAGIPAPSDAIDVCVSRRAKPIVSCASKKNDELRAMSEAICSWWEEQDLKQGAKRRSGKSSDGRPKRLLASSHTIVICIEPYI